MEWCDNKFRFHVEKGADVEARADGGSPLHWAVNTGNLDMIKYLVEEAGANINARDKKGKTPLDRAKKEAKLGVIKYLLKRVP